MAYHKIQNTQCVLPPYFTQELDGTQLQQIFIPYIQSIISEVQRQPIPSFRPELELQLPQVDTRSNTP